jgi:hypothetical protein
MYRFQSCWSTVNTQTVDGKLGFYRVREFHNHVNNFTLLNRDQASGSSFYEILMEYNVACNVLGYTVDIACYF